jgi:hypothetical protein
MRPPNSKKSIYSKKVQSFETVSQKKQNPKNINSYKKLLNDI